MLAQLNSPVMYLICGVIVLFIAAACVFFMVRAYKAGKAIGMDVTRMKRTITASATFAVLPSVGILLGVIALSGSLGTPLPWLRLSVIGALHYETQTAVAAAEQVGLPGLKMAYMTPEAFTTIALLMGFCISWGMLFCIFFNKRYLKKIGTTKEGSKTAGFGNLAMTAMFIGLVTAYIGSYIGDFVSGSHDWLPLVVVVIAGAVMAFFIWLSEKKNAAWVESFSIAASMIIAMASAAIIKLLV